MQNELEDLRYELSITLEAALLLAGVKKERLESAVEAYIDNIDEVLKDSDKEGADEVLEVIDFLKTHKKELFA